MADVTRPATEISPVPIAKAPSGIRGLDEVLLGGLPRNRITLIHGGSGCGKTVVALESLYRGALAGEPGVFATFEESIDTVRENAAALGWDLRGMEKKGLLRIFHGDVPNNLVRTGDFDITGLLAILDREMRLNNAKRLAIDALDVLLRLYPGADQRLQQLHVLHDWLRAKGVTSIITAKSLLAAGLDADPLEFMADCVIWLDQRVTGQVATRRLRVRKCRGSAFHSNELPYLITTGGTILMPVSTVALGDRPLGETASTGHQSLDRILGGGIRRNSCVLLAGATGTGKTTLASTIAQAATARGDRVLYVSMEEAVEPFATAMGTAGIDLRPAITAQAMVFLGIAPESAGIEDHLLRVLLAMDQVQPRLVVFDAISALQRGADAQSALDFVVRLHNTCKQRGVTCFLTNQVGASETIAHVSGVGVSSLVDTLILVELVRREKRLTRRLEVIKSRGGPHSHAVHAFAISDQGIIVSEDVEEAP